MADDGYDDGDVVDYISESEVDVWATGDDNRLRKRRFGGDDGAEGVGDWKKCSKKSKDTRAPPSRKVEDDSDIRAGLFDDEIQEMMKSLAAKEVDGRFLALKGECKRQAMRWWEVAMVGHVECRNPRLCGCASHVVRIGDPMKTVMANDYVGVITDEHGCWLAVAPRHVSPEVSFRPSKNYTKRTEEYAWIPVTANSVSTALEAFYSGDTLPGAKETSTTATGLGVGDTTGTTTVSLKDKSQRRVTDFFSAEVKKNAVSDAPRRGTTGTKKKTKTRPKHAGFPRDVYYFWIETVWVEKVPRGEDAPKGGDGEGGNTDPNINNNDAKASSVIV